MKPWPDGDLTWTHTAADHSTILDVEVTTTTSCQDNSAGLCVQILSSLPLTNLSLTWRMEFTGFWREKMSTYQSTLGTSRRHLQNQT